MKLKHFQYNASFIHNDVLCIVTNDVPDRFGYLAMIALYERIGGDELPIVPPCAYYLRPESTLICNSLLLACPKHVATLPEIFDKRQKEI